MEPYTYYFATLKERGVTLDVESIPTSCFAYSNIESCWLSERCARIEPDAFCYTDLKYISGEGVLSIGSFAFINCLSLETVYFPKAVSVEALAFSYCTNLKEVSLESCTQLGIEVFRCCSSLKSVVLRKRCTIGKLCFANCSNHLRIYINSKDAEWYAKAECWKPYRDYIEVQ